MRFKQRKRLQYQKRINNKKYRKKRKNLTLCPLLIGPLNPMIMLILYIIFLEHPKTHKLAEANQ